MMRQRSNTSPILRLTRNLICIGIAAFLILFTQNEQFCKKIIPTTNEQLETYSDIKQIAARLEEEILSGSGSFSFYTTRLDPSQIQNINSYIDPTFGSANYQETTNNRLAPKTTIKIQLKPAYYVYAAIMQHKAIPQQQDKSKTSLSSSKRRFESKDQAVDDGLPKRTGTARSFGKTMPL